MSLWTCARNWSCEPYICGNVGSGTVQEMSQWVEYVTFDGKSPMSDLRAAHGRSDPWKLKYFGVGNENWGCGGRMTAEYYADLYRRYGVYARNYGENRLFRIACGPRNDDYHWTEVMMAKAGDQALAQRSLYGRSRAALLHIGSAIVRRHARSGLRPSSTRPDGSRSSPRVS